MNRTSIKRKLLSLQRKMELSEESKKKQLNAYACAEIRRAICAVKLPKEPISDGKESGDGQGK